MLLAEALIERKDLDLKIKAVSDRAAGAARFSEGEEPPEGAEDLVAELRALHALYEDMVCRINTTNLSVKLDDGQSLTQAIAHRDALKRLSGHLTVIADAASPGADRGLWGRGRRQREDVAEKTDLDVRALRAEASALAKQARDLDVLIQKKNWSADLV